MLPYLTQHYGNPSSGHVFGTRAAAAVNKAREQVAALLGAQDHEIIFTSGGTEASNLAIRGTLEKRVGPQHVLTSAVEHPATEAPCRWLQAQGHSVDRLGVDEGGQILLEEAKAYLTPSTALVTVIHANNETGVLQPISALAEMVRASKAILHTDAAQSVGKVPVNVDDLGVDLLTVAGHKLYAPKGVGALYVRDRTALAPFALGAGHEGGLRPGTENVASNVGLGEACRLAQSELSKSATRMAALRDELWERLAAGIQGLAQNGIPQSRLPNTLNVRMPGVSGREVLLAAPQIAASTGSACHDGREEASSVILAMGVPAADALGSVRLSLGHGTRPADVSQAAESLIEAYRRLRQ